MPTLNKNPYTKTNWRDHIVDIISDDVIQEGTRFTASRANNIEEGIYNAYNWLVWYESELQKMRIQLEMVGRTPINNGTFFDTLEGNSKALSLLTKVAVSQHALAAGEITILLDQNEFSIGQQITIYDDEHSESSMVTAVNGNSITVESLVNQYKKGALVSKTNSIIDVNNQELGFGEWGTYSISISEVI